MPFTSKMAQDYEPWMIDAALAWIREGWSLNSFSSKHNVSSRNWALLLQRAPELQIVKTEYEQIRFNKTQREFYKGSLIEEAI